MRLLRSTPPYSRKINYMNDVSTVGSNLNTLYNVIEDIIDEEQRYMHSRKNVRKYYCKQLALIDVLSKLRQTVENCYIAFDSLLKTSMEQANKEVILTLEKIQTLLDKLFIGGGYEKLLYNLSIETQLITNNLPLYENNLPQLSGTHPRYFFINNQESIKINFTGIFEYASKTGYTPTLVFRVYSVESIPLKATRITAECIEFTVPVQSILQNSFYFIDYTEGTLTVPYPSSDLSGEKSEAKFKILTAALPLYAGELRLTYHTYSFGLFSNNKNVCLKWGETYSFFCGHFPWYFNLDTFEGCTISGSSSNTYTQIDCPYFDIHYQKDGWIIIKVTNESDLKL